MDFFTKMDEDISIDLTPLIDVVFMLLIFFIMTTTFSKPVLELVLPESENAEQQNKKEAEILISITKDGKIFYKNAVIDKAGLIALLNENPALLNVFVDKDAPFESFVNIVDIAKKEREGRFVISTEQKK